MSRLLGDEVKVIGEGGRSLQLARSHLSPPAVLQHMRHTSFNEDG